jgi:hypothetical protein
MRWLMLVVPILVAACGGGSMHEREQARNVYPQNYKAEILALMRSYLNDPTGVRDAFVSEPVPRTIDGGERYVSCVRYNAKKSGGQYAGSKDNMVVFRAGRLDRILDNEPARAQCKTASYTAFPELQKMSR